MERDTDLAQALRANTDTLYAHTPDALRQPGGHSVLFRAAGRDRTPNLPLLLWAGLTVVRWLLHPRGSQLIALNIAAGGIIVVWAGDEIIRGVNPWRRLLGGGVLAVVAVSWWAGS